MSQKLTLEAVTATLNPIGVLVESRPGEYRLSYRHATGGPQVFVDTLNEALEAGLGMAKDAPAAPPPPLGPTGRRKSRKGMMYRHNAKIAAKRLKAALSCRQQHKAT